MVVSTLPGIMVLPIVFTVSQLEPQINANTCSRFIGHVAASLVRQFQEELNVSNSYMYMCTSEF